MKKRVLSIWLFLCLLLTLFPSAAFASSGQAVQSGSCGENLTWTLDASGILTVSGTGAMENYNIRQGTPPPWYESREKITSAVFRNGVTETGDDAFRDCVNLTRVSMSNSLETIGSNSFLDCSKLDNVTIPNSVKTIYPGAFMSAGLSKIHIPASTERIYSSAFSNCKNLTAFSVESANKRYCSASGILFTADRTTLKCFPAGKFRNETSPQVVTLDNRITTVEARAFLGAVNLRTVNLPNTVEAIGEWAFGNCPDLGYMMLPKSLSKVDEHLFCNCSMLKTVSVPQTVTEIANHAFEGCSSLNNFCYAGKEGQWKSVKIGEGNEYAVSAVKLNVPAYTITIRTEGGPSNLFFDRQYFAGNKAAVTAPPADAGYHFTEWRDISGLTLQEGNVSSKSIALTMPAKDIAVRANYAFFSDVPSGAYYYQPVQWAVSQGITNGSSETAFSPGNTCTTANIITFLWRANGSPSPSASNPFSDVPADAYYAKAAAWAHDRGLITDSVFIGGSPCTRAAVMNYLWILAGKPKAGEIPFTDVPMSASYAGAVAWAVQQGITNGKSDTTFAPYETCTRGQIVTFLYRHYAA